MLWVTRLLAAFANTNKSSQLLREIVDCKVPAIIWAKDRADIPVAGYNCVLVILCVGSCQ